MARPQATYGQARQQVGQSVRSASPWLETWGRLGYAAHGIVYGLVGVLAAQAAFGGGGATTGTEGALEQIVAAPFGKVLLAATAVGLLGYATWRLLQAALDPDGRGSDSKGLATRAGYVASAVMHLGLAFAAARLLIGSGGGQSGDQRAQDWTATLLAQPFGPWLVGLVGLIVLGSGLYQLYEAYAAKFREDLKLDEMSAAEERWATRAGRLGFAARGVAFGLIGGFLVMAATQARPDQARGLGGALEALAGTPAGPWLLGAVALGLIAYGVFGLIEARYRRIAVRT